MRGTGYVGEVRPVLLKVRCTALLLQGDLSSFFPSFELTLKDQNLRKMLISTVEYGLPEDLKEDEVAVVRQARMGFGDRCAAPLAVAGRIKLADLVRIGKGDIADNLRPEIVRCLTHGSFVDDLFSGVEHGGELEPLKKGLEEAVDLGSFTIKE